MGAEARKTSNHPSGEQLIAYGAGDVGGTVDVTMSAHVAICAECAGVIARYRLVQDVVRADDALELPAAIVIRAKALFAAGASEPRPVPLSDLLTPLRRVVAELIFDSGSGLSPALAGFRGGGERHLTYVAQAVQVDLRVRPPEGHDGVWHVTGQVDADKLIPATAIDLAPAGEEQAIVQATTDEHGMFDLLAPAGRYDLVIRLPCALQVLPGLVLG